MAQRVESEYIHSLAISSVTSTMWPRRKIKQNIHFSMVLTVWKFENGIFPSCEEQSQPRGFP